MSKVAITGNASGTGVFTVASPNSNVDRVLTLPDESGTVITTATPGVPVNGPAFSAYADTDRSLTSGVFTKVIFGSELFDTNDNFASDRFTPTVAGYYQLNTIIRSSGTSVTNITHSFYKNGVAYSCFAQLGLSFTASQSVSGSELIYCNGTTDYVEVYMSVVATSPIMNWSSDSSTSTFSGFLARGV